MGRSAGGVRGVNLEEGDRVVAMDVVEPGASLLTVSANGYGKRSLTDDYRLVHRGAKGVYTMKVREKTGPVVGVLQVADEDADVMLVTNGGKLIRMSVRDIRVIGRNTQGVRLVKLEEDGQEQVVSVAHVAEKDVGGAAVDGEPAED